MENCFPQMWWDGAISPERYSEEFQDSKVSVSFTSIQITLSYDTKFQTLFFVVVLYKWIDNGIREVLQDNTDFLFQIQLTVDITLY